MSLGITEIVVILIIVLILFGGNKIPELARGIGKAQAEYKKAKRAIEHEVSELKGEVQEIAAAEEKKSQSVKKSPVKKAPAQKAPTKKTVKKVPAKSVAKTAVKKAPAKKPAAKKTTAAKAGKKAPTSTKK